MQKVLARVALFAIVLLMLAQFGTSMVLGG